MSRKLKWSSNNSSNSRYSSTRGIRRAKMINEPFKPNKIPILLFEMHGFVRALDTKCKTQKNPLKLLFRIIDSAPGENEFFSKLASHLLGDGMTPYFEREDLNADVLYKDFRLQVKGKMDFAGMFCDSIGDDVVHCNFAKAERYHNVINLLDSPICDKMLEYDENVKTPVGIFLLNTVSAELSRGLNLIKDPNFIAFLKTKKGQQCVFKFDNKHFQQYVFKLPVHLIYEYLVSLGFEKAMVIDASCESTIRPIIDSDNTEKLTRIVRKNLIEYETLRKDPEVHKKRLEEIETKWIELAEGQNIPLPRLKAYQANAKKKNALMWTVINKKGTRIR